MMKLNLSTLAVCAALACSGIACGGELIDLYRSAVANDPRYASARAQQESAHQAIPIARSYLLPRVTASGSYGRTEVQNDAPSFVGSRADHDYWFNSRNYSAVLSQPVYRPATWENYRQAEWQEKQADAFLDRNLDDLKTRVVQGYLQVMLAVARIDLIGQQKNRYAQILQQAQRAYDSGHGTITEIAESQSRMDELLAEDASARAVYDNRLAELRNIVGDSAYKPKSPGIPAFSPALHGGLSLQEWLSLARQNAPVIKEQEAKVKSAEYELNKAKAAYLPTADLRLQVGYDKDPGYTSINVTNKTKSAMLMVSVPLFEGGQTMAQSRKSAADLTAAREARRAAGDDLAASIEKEYGNVTAAVVRINALVKSVTTNELLVTSTKKSVAAGIRSNIDVLNAENQLFEARLKLTSARVDYLQALINLRAVAGVAWDDELMKIDGALQAKG